MPLGCWIDSVSPRAGMVLTVTYIYPRQGIRPAKRLMREMILPNPEECNQEKREIKKGRRNND